MAWKRVGKLSSEMMEGWERDGLARSEDRSEHILRLQYG